MNASAAIRSHIERVLSPSKVETLAAQMIRERLQLVKASEAARLLHMDSDEFRKLRIPVVTLGPKSRRYRVSDIETFISRRTSK